MLAYVAIFWVVVDLGVPFALVFAGAPVWTPLAWAFAKGVYIGFAKWPPPDLAIHVAYSRANGRGAIYPFATACPAIVLGQGSVRCCLQTRCGSTSYLWLAAILGAGFYLRKKPAMRPSSIMISDRVAPSYHKRMVGHGELTGARPFLQVPPIRQLTPPAVPTAGSSRAGHLPADPAGRYRVGRGG